MEVVSSPQPKAESRSFRWRCWYNGTLTEVTVFPPLRDERNANRGGIRGRIYNRNAGTLTTINGVVKQDGDGKLYFVSSLSSTAKD